MHFGKENMKDEHERFKDDLERLLMLHNLYCIEPNDIEKEWQFLDWKIYFIMKWQPKYDGPW
jgi:hypothetical protein